MQNNRVWERACGLVRTVVEGVRFDETADAIVVSARPDARDGLSQGLIESTNTKIRLLTRIAFGFHGPQPLIALALLALGSHPPRLPGGK